MGGKGGRCVEVVRVEVESAEASLCLQVCLCLCLCLCLCVSLCVYKACVFCRECRVKQPQQPLGQLPPCVHLSQVLHVGC